MKKLLFWVFLLLPLILLSQPIGSSEGDSSSTKMEDIYTEIKSVDEKLSKVNDEFDLKLSMLEFKINELNSVHQNKN